MRRAFLALLALLLSAPVFSQRREVHIVSANDMHAAIWAFPQLAAIVDSLRVEYPELLVFSAGDNRTGDPLNDKYEIPAYPMVALMNQVGFDASALGNHDFDVHSLARLTGLSNFRYICANMTSEPGTGINTVPSQVFDVDGIRVGVVGVIQLNSHGIPSTLPSNVDGLHFVPATDVVGQYEWMRCDCDVVILLSHLGYADDLDMARRFPWLDLIIGGHSHMQLKGDERENGVLITQNKNKLTRVTHSTLVVDSGRVVSKRAEYIDVQTFPKKNRVVDEMVRFFSDDPHFSRVLALAEAPFRAREELAIMMCDALIEGCHADMAVENNGGVRLDSLMAGNITVRDVLEMDPFDNDVVMVELTEQQIVRMLLSYCNNQLRRIPFVGGMRCVVTADESNPLMIKSLKLLTLDGKPLDKKRKYSVVTNNYVTDTSDIPQGSAIMLNKQTTDLIMHFLERKGTVNYAGQRRLQLAFPTFTDAFLRGFSRAAESFRSILKIKHI